MKKVKSSTVSGGVVVILLVVLISVVFQVTVFADVTQYPVTLILWYAVEIFMFLLGMSMLRTYYLTPEGILHYWIGIYYKTTKWEEIENISKVIIPKRGDILWITRKNADILPIEPDGVLNASEVLDMSGNYFTLLDKPEILDCIKEYYGPLDYDYKTDRTVF